MHCLAAIEQLILYERLDMTYMIGFIFLMLILDVALKIGERCAGRGRFNGKAD